MSATYLANSRMVFDVFPSYGLGDDAGKVESFLSQLTESTLESVSLGKPKKDALETLDEIFCACCQPGWDGYASSSALYESYVRAKRFIQALPTNLPVPEVAVDPDGEVSLEWYRSPRRVFSVSIGPNADLTYAGLYGANKTHGTETFNAAIPRAVLENIRRLLS